MTRFRMALLSATPLVVLAVVFTNEQHGLVWTGFLPGPDGTNSLIYLHGPIFLANVIYFYSLALAATLVLVRSALTAGALMRRQAAMVLLASAIPVVGAGMYALDLNPLPGLDLSTLSLSAAGVVLVIAILRLGMLDLVPVARDTLVERMVDGLLVADHRPGWWMPTPPPANCWRRPCSRSAPMSRACSRAGPRWSPVSTSPPTRNSSLCSIRPLGPTWTSGSRPSSTTRAGSPATSWSFATSAGARRSRLPCRRPTRSCAFTSARSSRCTGSSENGPSGTRLTGLFNRRYLDECLPAEFAEAREPGLPVGVVVMDLDQFKSFNDQLGHDAGDVMLRAAGHLLQANIRGGDTACRYGGEEFVVVLPGAPLEVTQRRADQWRQALEKLRVPYGDRELVCTLSAGVAAFPTHGATPADVLKAADQALYAAKAAGRNRVVVAGEASGPDAQAALPVDGAEPAGG